MQFAIAPPAAEVPLNALNARLTGATFATSALAVMFAGMALGLRPTGVVKHALQHASGAQELV
jgi:hypothetical protein